MGVWISHTSSIRKFLFILDSMPFSFRLRVVDLRCTLVLGLGSFLRRVEASTLEVDRTSFRCCRCLIRSCRLRMDRCIILPGCQEGEVPDSALFRNTGLRMPHVALVLTVIGTGQDLIIETLGPPSPVLIMPTTRIILTNIVPEEVQGTLLPQVLDNIIPPPPTILQDRNLTS